ncbi:cellulase family glycosylhydrolase [Chitinophaga sp. S165]|uniref:cellulase family glycosylhydrolase n=1 Tax=Chitinophaga sp. S165 TaxID=2135462 RepID=UPI000D712987|nr:cellulase family glycosylhydrolase [Chitinophaga sp. S165]PWV46992.1 putative secreted protein (Por secretion system target) [Chitinophaga sp. S165]
MKKIKPIVLLLSLFLAAYAHAQTPVAKNGQLKVVGTKLCNQYGNPIQLRGMSTHGIQWYGWGSCLTAASLDALAYDWGADVLRISLYVQEGGYETDPAGFTAQVNRLIEEATARGMYALVDWHQLSPGDPNYNLSRAKTFFSAIANTHKNKNNIIYDICNEPNSGATWAKIKTYADQMIPFIRAIDNDAVILVGTHGWSTMGLSGDGSLQDIFNNPLQFPNIMYTFHFYARDHRTQYLNQLNTASDRIPVFVTEFGTQEASGDGENDFAMAQQYIDLMRNKKISWTNWNYSDDFRSGAVWQSGTCSNGPWTPARLKPAGAWVRERMLVPADDFPGGGTNPVPTNLALGKTVTVTSIEDGTLVGGNAVDGNASTRWASEEGIDPQSITVDLGNNYSISQVKINWEAAYGKNFRVEISADNANWSLLRDVQNNTSLSNDFQNLSGTGRYIRIYGTARGTTYGYSIYELEVYGTQVSTPVATNIALNKTVAVSSIEGAEFAGNYAVDGNSTTRWSATLYVDPQTITVDLGSNYNISQVKIAWEAAYARDYLLQFSTDNANWVTAKNIQGNTSLNNDHSGLSATARYVRIHGTARGSEYGYSIYELEVYGTAAARQSTIALAAPKADQASQITVYPVPAHDQVTINLPASNKQKSQITLSDINGKVYFSGLTTGNTYRVNVSKLPVGMYIIQIVTGDKRTIKKIVKE